MEQFDNSANIVNYLCAKNLLVAHGHAYHIYDKEFRAKQGGQCGFTINIDWYGAHTNSSEDEKATEMAWQGDWGLYTEPILSAEGGFPKEFAERVAKKSAEQGFTRSRLPEFTEEEKALVRGSADFLGVNHYSGVLVSATVNKKLNPVPSMADDTDVGVVIPEEWPRSADIVTALCPNCLYKVLIQLQSRYNNPIPIYITETGWATTEESKLDDDDRVTYYRAQLEDVLDALDAGVNLKGFIAWSLMDNFEWIRGYTLRFGLYYIDFQDPARTRIPKKSAFVYKHIVNNRYIDHTYQPDSMTMAIDPGH
ncbi:unnamed protein product [Chrysodeixis includens]|uniref:Glycosyl hydrolase n=1 Tax=Chrysodeixis includens TaxID=689277 RepID=A0A9N8Q2S5_CHRIL|nr:unnamed protein product [Chrysodeixis includens]